MFDWIEKVYYPYIKKDPLCEKVLLIIHKSTSQISEDVIEKNKSNIMDILILLKELQVSCIYLIFQLIKNLKALLKKNIFIVLKKTNIY